MSKHEPSRLPLAIAETSLHGRAHLVGVAGSGMRAMADVLGQAGWVLSGSDVSSDGLQERLGNHVRLFQGHAVENLPPETEIVIHSDAVPSRNPELRRAAELGIPVVSYFQMLGRISAGRHTVAVAGTHGKSTTMAMAAHILARAGLDPTVFCGATPVGAASGGRLGVESGPMLIEACEYRRNFLHLRPTHGAILGIELDHFDCYDSLAEVEEAFRRFAALLPDDGLLLVRHDCVSSRRIAAGAACRIESFGVAPEANWSAVIKPRAPVAPGGGATTGRGFLEIRRRGRPFCEAPLPMPGRHNALNALAAAALAHENGATPEQIATGLAGFPGLHRRLEELGERDGIVHVDDYAHHPTEIAATLEAIREKFPRRRVWCVFQPHQACRTARLLDELAASLQNADKLLVADIFRAREGEPKAGEVTAADLARATAALGVEVLPGRADREIRQALETHLVAGDVLVTLGAGNMATWGLGIGPGRRLRSLSL